MVTGTLFCDFPDLAEGQFREAARGGGQHAGARGVARGPRLGDYVYLGKGEEGTGGRDKSSILADTLEAVIGAASTWTGGLAEADALVHLALRPGDRLLGPARRF